MKIWSHAEVCSTIALIVLGILLLMGRDSSLTVTFCSITGAVFTKALGIEIHQRVRRKRGR